MTGIVVRRRFLAPEVIQSSATDCGPAALKCLLEGYGISASYGRLREACQTDVDGTSIDTIEELAVQLGLEAEQVMVPVDHVLLPEARALPAIAVVTLPNGLTHFVVIWRRWGRLVQVMDPASGRHWTTASHVRDDLYEHELPVPAVAWREWAGSEEFIDPLHARLARLGIPAGEVAALIEQAQAASDWRPLAALDAATRLVSAIVQGGGVRRGPEAARLVRHFFERSRQTADQAEPDVPVAYWSVRPLPAEPGEEPRLLLRGAVLVRVRGRRRAVTGEGEAGKRVTGEPGQQLSPELVAALREPPTRPALELWRRLREDGVLAPVGLILAFFLAASGVVVEALLLRGLLDIGQQLGLAGQRGLVFAAILLFLAANLSVQLIMVNMVLRFGRHLEARLRMAFLAKLPWLGDRYFHSRLISDMAERAHSTHKLRELPPVGGELIRSLFALLLTTLGIIWLDPASAPLALLAAAAAVGVPLAAQPAMTERDLRVRSHLGALSRFYLDALLGLVAIRIHGAEQAVRREHEALLVEWARASRSFYRIVTSAEGWQTFTGFGLAAWLLFSHLGRGGEAGAVLLLVYWALNLPVIGQEVTVIARQYPTHRSVTLRLLEPLGAPEESDQPTSPPEAEQSEEGDTECMGVAVQMEQLSVRVAGHVILRDINLVIEPGEQVAIVGPSGAGKSTLVGLLLGFHRPAGGALRVDGRPLEGALRERLLRQTAWVDPTVQLWNRSCLDNLTYGADARDHLPVVRAIELADLLPVLEKLPNGLQTRLGEGGGLVSGGEGQRVRFARALLRGRPRLVILDEPFRGLDRPTRSRLLARARRFWAGATLLCITHDLAETRTFDRVVVLEGGRVVEVGRPAALLRRPDSRYRALLQQEQEARTALWSDASWRRLRLEQGQLVACQESLTDLARSRDAGVAEEEA